LQREGSLVFSGRGDDGFFDFHVCSASGGARALQKRQEASITCLGAAGERQALPGAPSFGGFA
jgi:hypothetical protein